MQEDEPPRGQHAAGRARPVAHVGGEGDGEPGWEQPGGDINKSDFPLPSIAQNCIDGEGNSIGMATSFPGPQELPLPGVPAGQTGYIFTGLGTSGVYDGQSNMKVHWVNITSGKYVFSATEAYLIEDGELRGSPEER